MRSHGPRGLANRESTMFKAIDVMQPEWIRQPLQRLWQQISPLYAIDEGQWLRELMPLADPTREQIISTEARATSLIEQVRADDGAIHMIRSEERRVGEEV